MIGKSERRTKHRFDTAGANQDESGSSHANVASGRELRPRGQKRAPVDDIGEESEGGSSSDDDDVEDSPFRVEPHHGKGVAQQSSSEEEEESAGDDDEENEESDENEQGITFLTIQKPVRLGSRKCIDYSRSGMTREVKRLRKIDPYSEPKSSADPKFHTQFQ